MLSPGINDAKQQLTDAYNSVVALDDFSTTCSNLQIVQLPKDPDWLPAVRAEVATLNRAADAWRLGRPDIWAPVLLSFENYTSTFAGFVSTVKRGEVTDPAVWIAALDEALLPSLAQAIAGCEKAKALMWDRRSEFSAVLPQMDQSIQVGWRALGTEEQDMLRLATELGGLNELVKSLGAKIDSDSLSGGQSYVSSAVSLLYAAGAGGAEASIPILGIVGAVITLGKSFYDLIADDDSIIAAMDRINTITAKLSDDALGVALTKSTVQILYSLEKGFLATRDAFPRLVDLWRAEKTKIQDAINALSSGARPDRYLDLLTLPISLTNWQEIEKYVRKLQEADITVGQPVTIDIGRREIRRTTTF